ncbi:hypothetical protein [Glutamicibacter sp. NPDC087344]|uniref:hypothetical protein n=1 Tax=Glutamicibacter sp. NPDC087344 TaxID=3363994 RepID=UPI003823DABC
MNKQNSGIEKGRSISDQESATTSAETHSKETTHSHSNARRSTQCRIRTCSEVSQFRLTTQGHPNGDIDELYCADHATLPVWGESPKQYTITITGPLGGTK